MNNVYNNVLLYIFACVCIDLYLPVFPWDCAHACLILCSALPISVHLCLLRVSLFLPRSVPLFMDSGNVNRKQTVNIKDGSSV